MKNRIKNLLLLQIVISFCFISCKNEAINSYKKNAHGVNFKLGKGNLEVTVISDNVLQCQYYITDEPKFKKSLMVVDRKINSGTWTLEQKDGSYLIKTSQIVAAINSKTGLISYFDKDMNTIVKENDRQLVPKEIAGEKVFNLSQTFGLSTDEAIYGLGQSQKGFMNLRNDSLELFQKNKEDYIPVIVSTNGYGILWDNYSYTLFKDNANGMNLWSEVGDGIDYYFIYGPGLDKVIAYYRDLTGGCPMLPKWAFGYVQSKERYKTQDEILGTVKEYRRRQIPLDVIVQDWHYWPEGQWGQKSFDSLRYPNPVKMLDELHNTYHTKFMISIWGVMTMGFPNSNEIFNTPGSNYYRIKPDEIYYDPFNQVSANLYWKQCNEGLFSKGVDAWWCDATEPEIDRVFIISADSVRKKMTTSMGSGARYMCAYPLMHSKNMYENQRKTTSEKRVVNLTRSGFGGQQRYSTIVWSGDIIGTWKVFKKQIPAGLNFCSTGIPYWTTDIGGFFIIPGGDDGGFSLGTADDEYKELYLRWFQFGAFCPMFRSHGTHFPREIWRFGEPGDWCFDALLKMDQLRYRLLPYIYSVGWMTTHNGYTMMRPLAFDFRTDKNITDIGDQYMFGPAIMVNPVTEAKYHKSGENSPKTASANSEVKTRPVYLPGKNEWYDFWTGESQVGGKTVHAPAPLDKIPLFIRAGSILPMGPIMQYSSEKPEDPIELRIYTGADGNFNLYEDENDNYNYEKGAYAEIPITWNEASQTLTIGKRMGSFPKMLVQRRFNVVFVADNKGIGLNQSIKSDYTVKYSGSEIKLKKLLKH